MREVIPYLNARLILILLLFCFLSGGVLSQKPDEPVEQKQVLQNKNRVLPAKDQIDIWSLNFGLAYMPINSELFVSEIPGINFSLNYHYEVLLFFKPEQSFSFGLGYDHFRINHEGRFLSSSATSFWENGDTIHGFEKGNLRLNSVKIPFEYRFRFKEKFKFYLGYNFEYLIGHRDITFIEGEKQDLKNIKNIRRLMHGANFRIGYKDLFLFGGVSFSNLIKSSDLNNHQLFRFGISIGG